MSLAASVRAFKAKAMSKTDAIVQGTVREMADNLVGPGEFNGPWTPLGEPESWKSPPPADYQPGNLRSSWFFSVGSPSTETTTQTDSREVHGLGDLTSIKAGSRLYLSNSAPHAGAIEDAHSSQAPAGILVNAAEFEPIVRTVAGRLDR